MRRRISEWEVSLVYRVRSRTYGYIWDPFHTKKVNKRKTSPGGALRRQRQVYL